MNVLYIILAPIFFLSVSKKISDIKSDTKNKNYGKLKVDVLFLLLMLIIIVLLILIIEKKISF